ncbi:MAG: pyridoxamine 5'-phosphate oxidase [Porticoccaceae bacterium]|jgi:pyridoxamine 5'-phosphate oxidase|nr:pyridoxamine 5'-phosphate oxidase [Porticoccaceae bacterium]|tara:strand:+ start:3893 stop:4528 length:636 start_codon:yes stop_codon:yes gene_type:complete
MGIKDNRREYDYGTLSRENLRSNPFEQFSLWMDQALEAEIVDPTAMSVATVDTQGKPWQRMVLLKGFDERGFVFYTNLGSRKVADIMSNPQVSLQFPWLQLDRQVIVGGKAEPLSDNENSDYFKSRPISSQLAAWASEQSSPIASREVLEAQFNAVQQRFESGEVPLPEFWGGYRIVPREFEFWQGGENRLHDRFSFQRDGDSWIISRLSP